MDQDMRILEVKNWKKVALDRDEWAELLKKARAQIFHTKPDGVRRVGRPKLRSEDGMDQDMRILEVKNWKKVALDRDEWAELLKKARAQIFHTKPDGVRRAGKPKLR